MNKTNRPLIGVHVQGGVIQRVTADGDSRVVVIEDGEGARVLDTVPDAGGETSAAESQATAATCVMGIKIACDLTVERLTQFVLTQEADPHRYVLGLVDIVESLHGMVKAAVQLGSTAAAR